MIQLEDVEKLAYLQEQIDLGKVSADKATEQLDKEIRRLQELRGITRDPYTKTIADHKTVIESLKQKIVDDWDGNDKSIKYEIGTLGFRKTTSLKIVDGGRLLEHIIENTSTTVAVDKYLKGFLLTSTKAYVDVHGIGAGVAKIEAKTTVSFKNNSG